MVTASKRKFPIVEVGVDSYELERAIAEAFVAALGEEQVIGVHVSRFPHEYGVIVLLRHEPSADVAALALEQEERFRTAGIPVGILVRKARGNAQTLER